MWNRRICWPSGRPPPFCWTGWSGWNTGLWLRRYRRVRRWRAAPLQEKGAGWRCGELTHDGGDLPGTLGIGTHRWATHGEPNDVNAHPHMSQSGKFAVVHNGIIENFITLKEEAAAEGLCVPVRDGHGGGGPALDYYYSDCGDFFRGHEPPAARGGRGYALGIICADYPGPAGGRPEGRPPPLGFGDGENFIASDVTALIRHTRDIAYMDDGGAGHSVPGGIRVYDRRGRWRRSTTMDWGGGRRGKRAATPTSCSRRSWRHPAAIRKATAARIQGGRVVLQDLTMTPSRSGPWAASISWPAARPIMWAWWANITWSGSLRRGVEVCLASEFRYADPIVGRGPGHRHQPVRRDPGHHGRPAGGQKAGARILSIVNVVGSSIARESDDVLYTWAGPEIAVATTKAYSTQMAVLNLLGLYFGEVMGTVDYETYTAMVRDILALPEKLEQVLARRIQIQQIARGFRRAGRRVLHRTEPGLCPEHGGLT